MAFANFACDFAIRMRNNSARESSFRRDAETSPRGVCAPLELQQLIRIDVDRDSDVFGKREFVERFADEAA